MSNPKRIVLDANILLRGAFGLRVRNLLASYQETVAFYTPDLCVEEALRHAPKIAKLRNLDPEHSRAYLSQLLQTCINVVDAPSTSSSKTAPRHEYQRATPTIGPSSPLLCSSTPPSGPKTRTSSAVASPPGPATKSNSTSATLSGTAEQG
jgi:hypothetical protein